MINWLNLINPVPVPELYKVPAVFFFSKISLKKFIGYVISVLGRGCNQFFFSYFNFNTPGFRKTVPTVCSLLMKTIYHSSQVAEGTVFRKNTV